MAEGLFDSAWLKFAWAVHHAPLIERDIQRFTSDPNRPPVITARAEYHPKRHAFAVVIDSMPALPARWGLMLGDVAFNLRAALDHLAWAIVCRGNRPPDALSGKQQRSVSFPISKDARTFAENAPTMLPGARRADLAILRRYQPYNRGESRAEWQTLSILARLNNLDKHRHLQPVLTLPTEGVQQITHIRDCELGKLRDRARSKPLKVGTELTTIPVRRTGPNPELKVDVSLSTQVCLDNTVPVVHWLDIATGWIAALLHEFAEPPPEATELIG